MYKFYILNNLYTENYNIFRKGVLNVDFGVQGERKLYFYKRRCYIMKYSQEEYFSCYSPNLKDYLINNGFEIYTQFVHVRENKICWVFKRVPSLSIYLEQWSRNRKINK